MTKEVAEVDRPGQAAWARWCAASKPAARPRRPASRPATSSPRSTASAVEKSGDLPRIVGGIKPGSKADAAGVPPRQLRATCSVTVAEIEPETAAPRAPAEREAPSRAGRQVGRSAWRCRELTDAQKRELKLKSGVRVEARRGRGRPRRRARGRRDRRDRQHRGDQRQAVRRRGRPSSTRRKPVSVLVRRGECANYLVIRPAR